MIGVLLSILDLRVSSLYITFHSPPPLAISHQQSHPHNSSSAAPPQSSPMPSCQWFVVHGHRRFVFRDLGRRSWSPEVRVSWSLGRWLSCWRRSSGFLDGRWLYTELAVADGFDLQIEGFYFVVLFLFWLFRSVQITLFGLNYKGDLGVISRER